MSAYELEMEDELELEDELEFEDEFELEDEGEAFLGDILRKLRGSGVAKTAARMAVTGGLGTGGRALGGYLAKRFGGGQIGQRLGRAAGQAVGSGLGSFASDILLAEPEAEMEYECETATLANVRTSALMDRLGAAAAESESEAEAEAFIGALVPLAARLVPKVAPAILKAAPRLIKGASKMVRALRSNPRTRKLVRATPTIMRRTAAALNKGAQRGQPVTPAKAVKTLGAQTLKVLRSPHTAAHAIRRTARPGAAPARRMMLRRRICRAA